MATDETFTRASKESTVSMATFMATNMATQGNESEGTKLNETQETPLNCVFVQEKEKACFQKTGLKLPLGESNPHVSDTVKHGTKRNTPSSDTPDFTPSEIKAYILNLILSLEPAERKILVAELLEIFGFYKAE